MKQLDLGTVDPELYEAVSTFQKEIRDSIKILSELKIKMKDFYKTIRDELAEINTGGENKDIVELDDENLNLIDTKILTKLIDEYKNNKHFDK